MKKKILLVYPEIPATYWSFKYAISFVSRKSSYPPLGLLTVAAMIPDDYDIKLVDMNVSKLKERDIKEADFVFISAMIVQKDSFEKVVELCNNIGTAVVAGGPYATSSYEKITGVDHFVLNEGEITLKKFFKDVEAGSPERVYLDDEKPEITTTPVPRFDLLDVSAYYAMCLQFSRGCPFKCEFCDIIEMFGRVPRTKTPEQFIREMDALYATGFRGSLFIVDDNFIGNKNRVKELLPAIKAWQKSKNYPFTLYTEASINLSAHEDLMDMMVEAGFNMVFIGIETPVEESLRQTQKKQNVKLDLLQSIDKIQRKGLEVTGGFIVGFDSDPENIFDLQIDFIQRSAIPMAMVGILMALPNTQLFRRLKSENRLLTESSGNNTHDLGINFISRIDQKKLISGYKRIISEIYKPENYFKRCSELIAKLPNSNFNSSNVTLIELKAFFLSLFKQTFSSYGLSYLRFIIKTLLWKPRVFPAAIGFAVMGQHFFKITREILAIDEFKSLINRSMEIIEKRISILPEHNPGLAVKELVEHLNQLLNQAKREFQKIDHDFRDSVKDTFYLFHGFMNNIIFDLERMAVFES